MVKHEESSINKILTKDFWSLLLLERKAVDVINKNYPKWNASNLEIFKKDRIMNNLKCLETLAIFLCDNNGTI